MQNCTPENFSGRRVVGPLVPMAFSGSTNGRWLLPLVVLAALVGTPDSVGRALGAAGARSAAHVIDYGPTGQVGSTITQVKVRFSNPV